MSKNFSFIFSDELAKKVTDESERKKSTVTDVIRGAVETYFQRDQERREIETLTYEVIRTRSVVLRGLNITDKAGEAELLEEAGKDATEYLEQQKTT